LRSTVAQQQKAMETLMAQLKEQAAQIQRVSAQVELNKLAKGRICRGVPASQTVSLPAVALHEGGNNP